LSGAKARRETTQRCAAYCGSAAVGFAARRASDRRRHVIPEGADGCPSVHFGDATRVPRRSPPRHGACAGDHLRPCRWSSCRHACRADGCPDLKLVNEADANDWGVTASGIVCD